MREITKSSDRSAFLLGDLVLFFVSLWLTLALRYQEIPSEKVWNEHLAPFSFLFLVWFGVFYLVGLYDKQTLLFHRRLPVLIISAQVINILVAALFFFFDPFFTIAPKTNLLLYLVISSVLISSWRLFGHRILWRSRNKESAILIGTGDALTELSEEINENKRYPLQFSLVIDTSQKDPEAIWNDVEGLLNTGVKKIVLDPSTLNETLLPRLYARSFRGVQFFDFNQMYEEVFDRIPLTSLGSEWFLAHLSPRKKPVYDLIKRVLDIVGASVVLVVMAVLFPPVYLLMRITEGKAPFFITQERRGLRLKPVSVLKVRTMRENDSASSSWLPEGGNRVTKVGAFLRKSSIDELPQAWNILKGDVSFIGPRSDISGLAERLSESIPYYNVRYLISPGITGWAQVNQRYSPGNISPQSIEETRLRLMYDLYYLKNRSLLLDFVIIAKTFRVLLTRLFV